MVAEKEGQAGAEMDGLGPYVYTGTGGKLPDCCIPVLFQPAQMHLLFPFPTLLNQRGA